MKLYTFISGDVCYITKSSSLKKAQVIGRENMALTQATLDYLEDTTTKLDERAFIPTEVYPINKKDIGNDDDTVWLD